MDERRSSLAGSIAKRSRIKDPNSDTVRQSGQAAALVMEKEMVAVFGPSPALDVLDFGAAAGRVTLPLARLFSRSRLTATDVDAECVEYFKMVAPRNCEAHTNEYYPPLPLLSASFDCVIAISVWSHFPDELAIRWLAEMQRVCRPDALLLISTAGLATFETWRTSAPRWANVPLQRYYDDQYIYLEFKGIGSAAGRWPGIEGVGSWGDTVMHPDYIRRRWSAFFDIVEIRERGMPGNQDLVIMRNRGNASAR